MYKLVGNSSWKSPVNWFKVGNTAEEGINMYESLKQEMVNKQLITPIEALQYGYRINPTGHIYLDLNYALKNLPDNLPFHAHHHIEKLEELDEWGPGDTSDPPADEEDMPDFTPKNIKIPMSNIPSG